MNERFLHVIPSPPAGRVREGLINASANGTSPPPTPPASGRGAQTALPLSKYKLVFLILISSILTACSTPETLFKPSVVDIPVAQPCVVPPVQKPPSQLQQITAQSSLFDKTRAALIELDERKAYETRLEAAVTACQ